MYDISRAGLGTPGLKAKVGDTMTFDIPTDDYFATEPIRFRGSAGGSRRRRTDGTVGLDSGLYRSFRGVSPSCGK